MNRAIVYVSTCGYASALEVEPGSDIEKDIQDNGEPVGLRTPSEPGFYLLIAGPVAKMPEIQSQDAISEWLDNTYPQATWRRLDVRMPDLPW